MTQSLGSKTRMRTHLCGEISLRESGHPVKLGGWVHRKRDHGGILFVDLRDRSGIVQVSFDPAKVAKSVMDAASTFGSEAVVLIEGMVAERPLEVRNPELPTGDIEIIPTSVVLVGPAETPAIPVAYGKGETLAAEELRLRYRYLDLRRSDLRENLLLRHRLLQATRQHLSGLAFHEIETPILTKPTPEGARDYLVPSRIHAGEFYALPQSPQLYKQLLMVSGFDRYFQLARCFRDEDLRADRQPEFTQIDMEASFVQREDIFEVSESMLATLWSVGGVEGITTPFPWISHADAMERFGTDRPDLRCDLELRDFSAAFADTQINFVRAALEDGGRVRGLMLPPGHALSRKQVADLEAIGKTAGLGGLMTLRRAGEALEGSIARHLSSEASAVIGLADGQMVLLAAGKDSVTSPALDRIRQDIAARLGLLRDGEHRFLWVTDFPLFAADAVTGAIVAEHHPFTAPHSDDLELLETRPLAARSLAYDCVYNGMELASGSVRISDPRLQARVLSILGIEADEAEKRFGFLLEGLRSGAPPHAGIAFGFDRIAMLLSAASSLRDVIAFPKTTAARALFEGAPVDIPDEELSQLHIRRNEEES